MKTKEDVQAMLRQLQGEQDAGWTADEEAIVAAYAKDGADSSTLAIKILSIFGGILASLAFIGFLFIAGLYNSGVGMVVTGVLAIACAIWLTKVAGKVIIDTISVSAFAIGFALVGLGLTQLHVGDNVICVLFIIMALVCLSIVQAFILSFLAVLVIAGSIMALIIANNYYNLFPFYIALLAVAVTYVFLQEATIISAGKALSRLYDPVRMALLFSFLAALWFVGNDRWMYEPLRFIWVPSVVIIAAILCLVFILFAVLGVNDIKTKVVVCLISTAILAATLFYPAIPGALLVVLLSFRVAHRTGLAAGAIAFVYFVSQYYYNLSFTLLTKSVILFLSGLLFIALYLFTHKKLSNDQAL